MASVFYEMYKLLCKKVGKSTSAVAKEIGLSNSTVSVWKRGGLLRSSTLIKVADYFGVSPDYLLGATADAQSDLAKSKTQEVLKPCPFCNGEAMLEDWTGGYEEGTTIQCKSCGACISENLETGNGWHHRAIKKWNQRFSTPHAK